MSTRRPHRRALVGREVAAAALIEVEVRGTWMERHFWERHWSKAADHPVPVGPYRSLRKRLARMPEPAFANDALRQALQAPEQRGRHPPRPARPA